LLPIRPSNGHHGRVPRAGLLQDHATGRRDALVLILWWIVVTGAVLLVGAAITSRVGRGVRIEDNDAERWFVEHRSPAITDAATGVSYLGDTLTTIGLSLVVLLVLWRILHRRRPLVFVVVVLVGELATYLVAVNTVQRPRPPVPRFDEGLDPLNSYPSGHVAAAMATYGGLAVLFWVLTRSRHRWLAPLLFVPAAVIALARLYLGVHHPTDVLMSVLFMSAWLNRCAAVLLRPEEGSRVF
jgi:undecaprenyl-diphosphatase